MKSVRWTVHALEKLQNREISRSEADKTLSAPEFEVSGQFSRRVFMRRYFDDILHQEMLLRLIIEDAPLERVVVTVYKTSQVEKYLKGIKP